MDAPESSVFGTARTARFRWKARGTDADIRLLLGGAKVEGVAFGLLTQGQIWAAYGRMTIMTAY
ncbi:MAG: hypothetical protein ACLSIR_11065 [Christensenellales bacterium]